MYNFRQILKNRKTSLLPSNQNIIRGGHPNQKEMISVVPLKNTHSEPKQFQTTYKVDRYKESGKIAELSLSKLKQNLVRFLYPQEDHARKSFDAKKNIKQSDEMLSLRKNNDYFRLTNYRSTNTRTRRLAQRNCKSQTENLIKKYQSVNKNHQISGENEITKKQLRNQNYKDKDTNHFFQKRNELRFEVEAKCFETTIHFRTSRRWREYPQKNLTPTVQKKDYSFPNPQDSDECRLEPWRKESQHDVVEF